MTNDSTKTRNEKRFRLTTTQFDGTLSFYDAECDCETRMSTEYVLDKVEITLNSLNEENNMLKDILKDIIIQLDANHTLHTYSMTIPINQVIYNELHRRLKETSFNEELRRFFE